jgi:6-phosphogluconolactonase
MSIPIVRTFADAEAVSRAAADEFVRRAAEATAERGRFAVALSGGSTPQHLYQLLAEPPYRGRVNWGHVEVFWGDERCVPPDHHDSNFRMANEAMLAKLPLRPGHVHRIEAERPDRDAAARDYQAAIARAFGVDPAGAPPAFDLILLGMGPDGHTASLFPETAALEETARWVVVNYVPKFAADRITMTYPILDRAHELLFLVAGADKAERLAEVLEGSPDPRRLPSQRVRPLNGRQLWYVDRAAAARLIGPLAGGAERGANA